MSKKIEFRYQPGDKVVEISTDLQGRVEKSAIDAVGVVYEIHFEIRQHGRRLHWKREKEIKRAPKPKANQ